MEPEKDKSNPDDMSWYERFFMYMCVFSVTIVGLFAVYHNSRDENQERINHIEEKVEALWDYQMTMQGMEYAG